jgi:hypothetical protein
MFSPKKEKRNTGNNKKRKIRKFRNIIKNIRIKRGFILKRKNSFRKQ